MNWTHPIIDYSAYDMYCGGRPNRRGGHYTQVPSNQTERKKSEAVVFRIDASEGKAKSIESHVVAIQESR
jgi:hypothetical protein